MMHATGDMVRIKSSIGFISDVSIDDHTGTEKCRVCFLDGQPDRIILGSEIDELIMHGSLVSVNGLDGSLN